MLKIFPLNLAEFVFEDFPCLGLSKVDCLEFLPEKLNLGDFPPFTVRGD